MGRQVDQPGHGKNADREMQNEKWIRQVGQDSSRELGAFIVITGEQPETFGQTSALFGGLNQREIKGRKPTAEAQHRFRQRGALRETRDEPRERFAE